MQQRGFSPSLKNAGLNLPAVELKLFGGNHFLGGWLHFVGVVALNANHHESAIALEFTIADHVAEGATARERGFAIIFFVLHLLQRA